MIRKLKILVILVLCFHFLSAQNFATRQLEYLASLMKCTLPTYSDTFFCPQISNFPLTIEYDSLGVVSHLGIALFADSLKTHILTKPLYLFQERLFMELFLQENETKAKKLLAEYKVDWTDNSMILGTKSFFKSLESSLRFASHANKYVMSKDSLAWTSSWQDSIRSFILNFPANFDLISGMDKKEAEISLAKELQNFQCLSITTSSIKGNMGEMQQLNRSNYVMNGNALFTQAMNSNVYFQVLHDPKFPDESIANLFNYPDIQKTKGLDMQIRQTAYGGKAFNYRIKLTDFQCFMSDDYEVFTGIEKCSSDIAEFSVIYKSKWYNHCHLLYIKTTPQNLFDKTELLNAVFYTFIPNHNITNLYKEYIKQ